MRTIPLLCAALISHSHAVQADVAPGVPGIYVGKVKISTAETGTVKPVVTKNNLELSIAPGGNYFMTVDDSLYSAASITGDTSTLGGWYNAGDATFSIQAFLKNGKGSGSFLRVERSLGTTYVKIIEGTFKLKKTQAMRNL